MLLSKYFFANLRNTPTETEVISHQLMLRTSMVRKIAAGIYTWLPMGLRVLRKVEAIIRHEMDAIGAQELLMPSVQPAELWHESQRWDQYGYELLRFQDRHKRDFCMGPTHEEIITDLVRREIRSYKQLPACFYQIQTKFRDEIRPRFGIMRAREFCMKDAYSFHLTERSLTEQYTQMSEGYSRIFENLGLKFCVVQADSGNIGGSKSHEFHVLANSGEDQIVFSETSAYATNIELAQANMPEGARALPTATLEIIETPAQHSIAEISQFLNISADKCIKTLIVKGQEGSLVALVLRGDHMLNRVKAEKIPQVLRPLEFASAEEINSTLNCSPGFIGPIDLNIAIIADHSAVNMSDFVCGANEDNKHYMGVNWGRDIVEPTSADIRNVTQGEDAPDGSGKLNIMRGIEVGHIFQLGQKYSTLMDAKCLDKEGNAQTLFMGCYGIGVSRVVAAAIEQNNDDRGIVWPLAIAPFQVILLPINMHKSQLLYQAVMALYNDLKDAGFEVLLDDRKERPGVMFTDAELLGIPHRLVFSERGMAANSIEYQARTDTKGIDVDLSQLINMLTEKLQK